MHHTGSLHGQWPLCSACQHPSNNFSDTTQSTALLQHTRLIHVYRFTVSSWLLVTDLNTKRYFDKDRLGTRCKSGPKWHIRAHFRVNRSDVHLYTKDIGVTSRAFLWENAHGNTVPAPLTDYSYLLSIYERAFFFPFIKKALVSSPDFYVCSVGECRI